ncbi:hypothetical protein BT69DRAFT_1320131 [Atractiella rhizophila]|nr:hypothetical protein BT69DRAFT_1320131 [Atractiella rhizophila]
MASATPLSLPSNSQPTRAGPSRSEPPTALRKGKGAAAASSSNATTKDELKLGLGGEITSAVELNDWVDSLLTNLESRFDQMSEEVKERLQAATSRIDSLEQSIADLMQNPPMDPTASPGANLGQGS